MEGNSVHCKNKETAEKMKTRSIVYGLLSLFILIFVNGFLEWGGKTLLLLSILFFLLGCTLFVLLPPQGKLRTFLLVTGVSTLGFSTTLVYGVLGIWGYYDIYDPLYLTVGIIFGIGFVIGSIGSVMAQ